MQSSAKYPPLRGEHFNFMSIKPENLNISEEEELKIRCQVNEEIEEDATYILNSIFKDISEVNKIIDERFGGEEQFFETAVDLNSIEPVDSILAPENDANHRTGYEKRDIQKVKESFDEWRRSLPQKGSVNSSWHPSSLDGKAFVLHAKTITWNYKYMELVLTIYHLFHNILKAIENKNFEKIVQREIYRLYMRGSYTNKEEEMACSRAGIIRDRTETRHQGLLQKYRSAILWLEEEVNAKLKISNQDSSKKWETTLALRQMIEDKPEKCNFKPPAWIRDEYQRFLSAKIKKRSTPRIPSGLPSSPKLRTDEDMLKAEGEEPNEEKIRKEYLTNLRRRIWWWQSKIKGHDQVKDDTLNSSTEK